MGYILFSSQDNIYLYTKKRWNGIIEYSYDNKEWNVWYGEQLVSDKIYMRGINNTIISCGKKWSVIGSHVKCQGNIENLLDYKSVINNIHPKMDTYCFGGMFAECRDLMEAPQLLSEELSYSCYQAMFWHCVLLTKAPKLSAVQLTDGCYFRTFEGCNSLTESSCFPSLSIAKEAVINQHMFEDCPIQTVNINNKLYDINVLKLL